MFQKENEEFTRKVATTIKEAKTLIEAGFTYICELEGTKLFRKRR